MAQTVVFGFLATLAVAGLFYLWKRHTSPRTVAVSIRLDRSAPGAHVLWSLAHSQGFKLPTKNYFEFVEMITARPENVSNLDDYLRIMHTWTEKIQSSPMAIERSVYEVIGKEYRGSRVTQIELRFNPMKRNLDSTLDLDHIIHAALRGMDRATLEYGVRAGLIF